MKIEGISTILIRVPQAYEDTIKCGNTDLYLDTRFNDVRHTRRYGEVVSSPDSRFCPGDIIYFHHNIVRRISAQDGTIKETPDEIFDHIFHVPCNEVYAIRRKGILKAVSPYCFISPVREEQKEVAGLKIISKNKFKAQWGIVKYGNDELEEQGVHEGDTIIFTKNSEYSYPIDGEELYRMKTRWIAGKISGLQG